MKNVKYQNKLKKKLGKTRYKEKRSFRMSSEIETKFLLPRGVSFYFFKIFFSVFIFGFFFFTVWLTKKGNKNGACLGGCAGWWQSSFWLRTSPYRVSFVCVFYWRESPFSFDLFISIYFFCVCVCVDFIGQSTALSLSFSAAVVPSFT